MKSRSASIKHNFQPPRRDLIPEESLPEQGEVVQRPIDCLGIPDSHLAYELNASRISTHTISPRCDRDQPDPKHAPSRVFTIGMRIREDVFCQLGVQLVVYAGRMHCAFSLAIGAQADQSHADQFVERRS